MGLTPHIFVTSFIPLCLHIFSNNMNLGVQIWISRKLQNFVKKLLLLLLRFLTLLDEVQLLPGFWATPILLHCFLFVKNLEILPITKSAKPVPGSPEPQSVFFIFFCKNCRNILTKYYPDYSHVWWRAEAWRQCET